MSSSYFFEIKKEREKKMVKEKPCVVCGRLTKRALFQGNPEEVLICSELCETQYFESLGSEKATRLRSLKCLDEEIAKTRKHERDCWVGATLGLILIFFGIFLTALSPTREFDVGLLFFMTGLIPLTGGALATRHFSNMRAKLLMKRRQMV